MTTPDGQHVAHVFAHGLIFEGRASTPEQALRAAQVQATAHARRETARTIGLTLCALSLLSLTLHLLT